MERRVNVRMKKLLYWWWWGTNVERWRGEATRYMWRKDTAYVIAKNQVLHMQMDEPGLYMNAQRVSDIDKLV